MSSSRRLEVSIDDQTLDVIDGSETVRQFRISTAAKGMGFTPESHRTPTGRFRISEKIGDGEPATTIFKSREPVRLWEPGGHDPGDHVLGRILRLDGLDPENANSLERYIYIHGTNHADKIGRPASYGCIRLAPDDMIGLFDMIETGAELTIRPATRRQGRLWFFDCDSTLSTIEGIDELARARGPEVFARVVALTEAAMNGEIPIHEVFPRRMEMIAPDRAACDQVARLYQETVVPGIPRLVAALRERGWLPVILSGGFAPLIRPLADDLGIEHVEAVPLYLNGDGSYQGYGSAYPTTRNLGKNEIIREWRKAMLPEQVVMMGDGISDLETRPDVDCFIGYGGVAARDKVKAGSDIWLTGLDDLSFLDRLQATL